MTSLGGILQILRAYKTDSYKFDELRKHRLSPEYAPDIIQVLDQFASYKHMLEALNFIFKEGVKIPLKEIQFILSSGANRDRSAALKDDYRRKALGLSIENLLEKTTTRKAMHFPIGEIKCILSSFETDRFRLDALKFIVGQMDRTKHSYFAGDIAVILKLFDGDDYRINASDVLFGRVPSGEWIKFPSTASINSTLKRRNIYTVPNAEISICDGKIINLLFKFSIQPFDMAFHYEGIRPVGLSFMWPYSVSSEMENFWDSIVAKFPIVKITFDNHFLSCDTNCGCKYKCDCQGNMRITSYRKKDNKVEIKISTEGTEKSKIVLNDWKI